MQETDEINETDVERGGQARGDYYCEIINVDNYFYYVSAYSRSQTCEAFSYHLVINSTQLHYRYLFS